ncbi:MAG: DUF3015 domain-containing protein [Deltaproteobacteria bacterium]|nr:DUF3015 domain-containing protein [Deltaproteobacteria bacterium]
MKKMIFVALAAFAFIPTSAFAANYGMAGCGLGSIVFGSDPGFMQVFAATTNGTFASQTFGITTGTSNCTDGGAVVRGQEQKAFVEANYAQLSRDTARGEGEYLAAFSTLLGCKVEKQNEVFVRSQASHDQIFQSEANPDQVIQGFKAALSADEKLAASCKL